MSSLANGCRCWEEVAQIQRRNMQLGSSQSFPILICSLSHFCSLMQPRWRCSLSRTPLSACPCFKHKNATAMHVKTVSTTKASSSKIRLHPLVITIFLCAWLLSAPQLIASCAGFANFFRQVSLCPAEKCLDTHIPPESAIYDLFNCVACSSSQSCLLFPTFPFPCRLVSPTIAIVLSVTAVLFFGRSWMKECSLPTTLPSEYSNLLMSQALYVMLKSQQIKTLQTCADLANQSSYQDVNKDPGECRWNHSSSSLQELWVGDRGVVCSPGPPPHAHHLPHRLANFQSPGLVLGRRSWSEPPLRLSIGKLAIA